MNYQTIKRGILAALMLFSVVVSVQGQIPTGDANSEESTLLLPFYLLSQQDDNGQLGPPLPFNPYPGLTATALDNGRGYLIDDLDVVVAKSLLSVVTLNSSEPPGLPPDGETDTNYYNGVTHRYNIYGSNSVWLELGIDANDPTLVDPILHNPTNAYWELFSKEDLSSPTGIAAWVPLEVEPWDGSTNPLAFLSYATIGNAQTYYRAVGGNTVVSMGLDSYSYTPVRPCTSATNDTGTQGIFKVTVIPSIAQDLTIRYTISGSASNGVDFTTINGSVVVPSGTSYGYIYIEPQYSSNLNFEESVTLTTILTNGYLIDPDKPSATMWIRECANRSVFDIVATNVPTPVGIDYLSQSNCLLLSVNYDGGDPNVFDLLHTNGTLTSWSGIHGLPDEVKLAVVKSSTSGFTKGDIYLGANNDIGWLSSNGATSNITWCTLTNSFVTNALPIRGSIYVDQTGTFSNNIIAVASSGTVFMGYKGVWQVNALGQPTLLANIYASHLEGVITITNDASKWGPWAGKILSGDESAVNINNYPRPVVYSINTNGTVASFRLDIEPEDFDIIPANQDLYACDPNGTIVRVSQSMFTNSIGDLLITQAGEFDASHPSAMFIVHWNGSTFTARRMTYLRADGSPGQLEHASFAPISLPTIPH